MGPEILLTWPAFVSLGAFVLFSLGVISGVTSPQFQSIGWQRIFLGYACALGALVVVVFIQPHFEGIDLLWHVALAGYLILPWLTLVVLPILLWQQKPSRALSVVTVAAILLVGFVGLIMWPNNIEGYDRALVVKNQLSELMELLVSLISTALAFYIGSRSRKQVTSNDA
jgi:hypothetical protein